MYKRQSVISETLVRLAKDNKDIVAVTPAMITGSKLEKFFAVYPERAFDCGIAEEHAATFCAGLAISRRNRTALQIVIAYLAQLVPWMLVSRCVFIYHYYPSVSFLILALVMMMKTLVEWKPAMKKRIAVFLAACVVVFVLFLPATAGFGTTQAYIDGVLRWFGSWYFG